MHLGCVCFAFVVCIFFAFVFVACICFALLVCIFFAFVFCLLFFALLVCIFFAFDFCLHSFRVACLHVLGNSHLLVLLLPFYFLCKPRILVLQDAIPLCCCWSFVCCLRVLVACLSVGFVLVLGCLIAYL